MPIQDNVTGALLISAIDFILSFVIIGGIGVILSLFPLLNRFGKQDGKIPPALPGHQAAHKTARPTAATSTGSPPTPVSTLSGIHPGLTDQQLVVLLTAAASETLGGAVRIDRFRPLTAKDWNWASQGRQALQSHRLK